jgi:hypothetical protein
VLVPVVIANCPAAAATMTPEAVETRIARSCLRHRRHLEGPLPNCKVPLYVLYLGLAISNHIYCYVDAKRNMHGAHKARAFEYVLLSAARRGHIPVCGAARAG